MIKKEKLSGADCMQSTPYEVGTLRLADFHQ